jgi:hypothetical protein
MIVATKRIRKHASVIPYFLIAILLSHPVWPSGGVPWTDGSIVEKELFVPSLPEAITLGGILTPPGFVQASAFGIYPDGAGIRRPSENVRNFLWYSKTPSRMEFRSHIDGTSSAT